jgi:hypothetical protein
VGSILGSRGWSRRLGIVALVAMLGCGSPREPLSTQDEVRRVAFVKGMELLREGGMTGPDRVCVATRVAFARSGVEVDDPSPALVRALRRGHLLLRRGSDCTYPEPGGVRGAYWLPATLMWVDQVSIRGGNRATARIAYYVEPLYSASFECALQLSHGQWRVTECTLLSVS